MSLLSKLFGRAQTSSPQAQSVEHKGFTITPTPVREGPKFRISAQIQKDVNGQPLTHTLIRADVMDDWDDAVMACIRKAKQVINEQGERLFD